MAIDQMCVVITESKKKSVKMFFQQRAPMHRHCIKNVFQYEFRTRTK